MYAARKWTTQPGLLYYIYVTTVFLYIAKWTTQHGVLYYIYVTIINIMHKLQEIINLLEASLNLHRNPAGVREILFAINIDFLKIVFLLLIVYNNVEKIYNNTYLHKFFS